MRIRKSRSTLKILKSWPEIAAYLRVDESLAQLWHAKFELPIYHLPEANEVYTTTQDLMRWLRCWRVEDYLKYKDEIKEPPDVAKIKRRLAQKRRRQAYYYQKKEAEANAPASPSDKDANPNGELSDYDDTSDD